MKFENIGKRVKKVAKAAGFALGVGIASLGDAKGQSPTNDIGDFKNILTPKFNVDMKKYPGMHPAQAFEIQSYENSTLEGKIEMTKQAIDATQQNIKIDKADGLDTRELEEELRTLQDRLKNLEKQSEPSA